MTKLHKKMNLKDFCEEGYLQEVNRKFFHPLGLAMEITQFDDGRYEFTGIKDAREDPEGFIFTDMSDPSFKEKARKVAKELAKRRLARKTLLGGSIIQRIGKKVG